MPFVNELFTYGVLRLTMPTARQFGFTLIELSIVLVIIGLLVGGILVGQDLIDGARLRAGIAQLEKFDTSVNTFKLKYKYLPGDIPAVNAGRLGFFQLSNGYGNGNGFMENNCAPESLLFWRHLGEADLIDGEYGTTGNSAINPATGAVTANVTSEFGRSLPAGKMGSGGYYLPSILDSPSVGRTNAYMFSRFSILMAIGGCASAADYPLTPIEMQQLDVKVDNGFPGTGRFLVLGNWAPAATAGNCLWGGTGLFDSFYNTSVSTGGDRLACFFYKSFTK